MFYYEQELVNFLAQPENLPTALEVSAHIEQVKDRLQCAFWLAMRTELESLLVQSDLHHHWEVRYRPSPSEPVSDYYWCGFQQKMHSLNAVNHLLIQLQQSNRKADHKLYCGIRWNHKPEGDIELSAAQELESKLATTGYRQDLPWYVGRRDFDQYPRRNDFLIAMAECPGELVAEISQVIWLLFKKWHNAVVHVDTELAA